MYNNIKIEYGLEDLASRIMRTRDNYGRLVVDGDDVCYTEGTVDLIHRAGDYLVQNSPVRKIIPFRYSGEYPPYNGGKDTISFSEEIVVSELKDEGELKEKLNELIKKLIIEESKFITNFLINFAEKNNSISSMGESTIEKIVDILINSPEIVIIADENLKEMITCNKLYEDNVDIINEDNICFLEELEDYIIQIDYSKGSFGIFHITMAFNGGDDSEHNFSMLCNEYIDLQSTNSDFISAIKIN